MLTVKGLQTMEGFIPEYPECQPLYCYSCRELFRPVGK
jgi:hypothetical protein